MCFIARRQWSLWQFPISIFIPRFYRGKILTEWLLIDELAILLQIELARHKLEDE